ncbi:unnamed protein product [Aphanomyces euteiches]
MASLQFAINPCNAMKMERQEDGVYVAVATPKAVEHVVEEKGKTPPHKMVSYAELFQFADTTDKVLMFIGGLSAMIVGVLMPIENIFIGQVVNSFNPVGGGVGPDFERSINRTLYQLLVVGAAVLVCSFLQVACSTIAASRQAKRLRHAYASAILRQEIGWFDTNDPMQLATRVADTTLLVQEGMGRKISDGLYYLSMGVGSIVIAFIYGWQLTLVLLAFTPLIGWSTFYMTNAITAAVQGGVDVYAEAGGIAEESLSNIKTVHMFNAMGAMADKYMAALKKTQQAGVKKGLAVGVGTGMMYFTMLCSYAVGMYYGTVLITNDQMGETKCSGSRCYDAGRVIVVFYCIVDGAMGLGQAGPSIQAMTTARSAAYDIFQLLRRQSKIDSSSTDGKTLDHVDGHITLENVRFAYPSRPDVQVAAGYSLSIPAGQKIALVGSSGSGKSTIVSLLERFYDPLDGRVTLDGHDLKDLNVQWLRDQIGLVGQEPTLFSDTIAHNIRRGKPGATIEEVHEAAKQANAYDFIMGFPLGFDTAVGDRGAQLSGGQKQRIAIARAIIKNPAVLLLDEATSALDTESEHVVQASLDRLLASHQRTTVIIAHRLSTIRDADRIVVLDHGQVVEDGNHESLLTIENGHYKALVEAQSRGGGGDDKEDKEDVGEKAQLVRKVSFALTKASEETASETSEADPSVRDVPLSRVWRLSRPDTWHIVFGGMGALVHGGLYPIWGLLMTKCMVVFFQQERGVHGMRVEGLKWSMGFIGLAAAIFIALAVQCHQFALVCERLTARIRGMCFRSMLRQDIGWFDDATNSSGALTTRLATDSGAIRVMTAETLNAVLIYFSTLSVTFAICFYYSWRMTLVFMAMLPVLAAGMTLQLQMIAAAGKTVNNGDVKAGALLNEAVNAIRTVASFNLADATNAAYLVNLQASAAADRKEGYGGGVAYSMSQSSMIFALAGIFYYGGWLTRHGLLDFQSMFMVLNVASFCTLGVGTGAQGMGDVLKAKKAVKSIFAIIDRQPPIDAMDVDAGIKLDHVKGDVELRGLDFTYPSRPDSKIYKNYNLHIQSGQTVALVGGSGSGKSTAINLIERFYDPNAGAVFLDGVDLKAINVQSLRNHISIVSQEPVLFVGTIGENIATGKPGATQAEIEDAAKKANAHAFIMQFPDGYNTSVGDRGVQVSGDPEILLLDEATSALDNESERIVQASLDALLQQKRRTTIVVAHRLSTIRNADVIAVTEGGRIAELGTHNELLAIPNGIYANLVARQMQ